MQDVHRSSSYSAIVVGVSLTCCRLLSSTCGSFVGTADASMSMCCWYCHARITKGSGGFLLAKYMCLAKGYHHMMSCVVVGISCKHKSTLPWM